MAKDPYFEVKAEVESSLISAKTLYESYRRIILTLPIESHSSSDELNWSRRELISSLSNLSEDLIELDRSVTVLERQNSSNKSGNGYDDDNGGGDGSRRFGISEKEVKKRRNWIRSAQQQLKEIEDSLKSNDKEPRQFPKISNRQNDYNEEGDDFDYDPLLNARLERDRSVEGRQAKTSSSLARESGTKRNERHEGFRDHSSIDINDESELFHQEHKMMMINKQDQTLSTISGVVGVLREQANLMGREIGDQNIMLEDLDEGIDRTESRLSKANRKLNKFVDDNKNSKSSWLIIILIVLLVCLLIAIVLV
ncbi:hypothetical protein BY996DRAFT_6434463 [Phakopsora pachyrhizi]|uniref:t-SNARE affecting a late Golgi compartment protein 1 n=1 Tax=Phakopsora pachyrhizi TaxID=170000 RepID=A0AAV0BBK8_PHAPC|nr:hypothetical protein BY996DRAFT_6434463 [Phakopsora pachyrhizi]CAH7684737.1 hypothetical protein PPACK8108_LOCUS19155 [Phakopsora pachyrhizi]